MILAVAMSLSGQVVLAALFMCVGTIFVKKRT